MLYLRLPIAIHLYGEVLSGEIYLPSRMRGISICVTRETSSVSRRQVCERLGESGRATLMVFAPEKLLSRHVIAAVDWVRSKRLLRSLPIDIVALGKDGKTAEKAALRRPVSVTDVLSDLAPAV